MKNYYYINKMEQNTYTYKLVRSQNKNKKYTLICPDGKKVNFGAV